MLHIPALWYFGTWITYPPWFRVKLVVIPPRFIQQHYLWNIAIQPAVGCSNSWANLRCFGCYPLGGKLLWNRSIVKVVLQIMHSPTHLGLETDCVSILLYTGLCVYTMCVISGPSLWGLNYRTYEECCAINRYHGQGQVITSHNICNYTSLPLIVVSGTTLLI